MQEKYKSTACAVHILGMDHIHAHTCTASDTQLKHTNRKTTSHVRKKVDEFIILLWQKKKKKKQWKK